jgi:hypothetical protein
MNMLPTHFLKVTRYARAVRFWWLLAIALVAFLGFGEARAQTCPRVGDAEGGFSYTTRAKALAACNQWSQCVAQQQAASGNNWTNVRCVNRSAAAVGGSPYVGGYEPIYGGSGTSGFNIGDYFRYLSTCPSGSTWNNTTNTCNCPAGQTYNVATNTCETPCDGVLQPDGTCKSCDDLNDEPGSPFLEGNIVRNYRSRCIGGCMLTMSGGGCTTTSVLGITTMTCSGSFRYTTSCSANPPPPEGPSDDRPEPTEEPPQDCVPAGAGQTFCRKRNGDECYNASTGRQICWKPGETGDKGDANVLQTRGPGTQPKPPSQPTTNAGDPYNPTGTPITNTTTTINNSTVTNTITTTTRNHTTGSGTNAKPTNDGESDDGRDPQDGDPDGTTATGGGNCETPPIVSGDAALNMVANQAWATRCAVEAGNAANVTGDVGDCQSPFTVEGDNANAEQLRAMRAMICGEENSNAADSDSLGNAADGMEPGEGDSVFAGDGSGGTLSTSRFGGGGACPDISFTLPTGGTFTTPPQMCSILAALRLLFLAIATIWAIRIIGSE